MGVELLRIDDRLVHGQVVEGWLRTLRIAHVVVASDAVMADETQKALFFLATPQGVQLDCLSVVDAAQAWKSGQWENGKVLVLVSSPQDALTLFENGAPVTSINVGGLHFREGRVQVLKAISLNDDDVSALRRLSDAGIILEARPLPLDEPIELKAYLGRWQGDQKSVQGQTR